MRGIALSSSTSFFDFIKLSLMTMISASKLKVGYFNDNSLYPLVLILQYLLKLKSTIFFCMFEGVSNDIKCFKVSLLGSSHVMYILKKFSIQRSNPIFKIGQLLRTHKVTDNLKHFSVFKQHLHSLWYWKMTLKFACLPFKSLSTSSNLEYKKKHYR